MPEIRFLTREQIHEKYGFHTPGALRVLASRGRGPGFYMIGGRAYYDEDEYLAYLRSDRREPRKEAAPRNRPQSPASRRPKLSRRKSSDKNPATS